MRKWPQTSWARIALALLGAIPIAVVCAWSVFWLTSQLFVKLYSHDGQDSLASAALALVAFPIFGVASFLSLFNIQRKWTSGDHWA